MKDYGKMASFMVMDVLRQQILSTMGILNKESLTYQEHTFGQMEDTIRESTTWAKSKDLENISSMMEKYMKGNGRTGRNMGKVKQYILMVDLK